MSKYLLKLYSKIYRSYKSLAKRITFCTYNIKIEILRNNTFFLLKFDLENKNEFEQAWLALMSSSTEL